jgi:putative drug exporter of the RND superfamily
MSRTREEATHADTRVAMHRALTVTGGVITSAGLVLAATFGTLGVLPLVNLSQTAFIVGFGVLLDTFIVRALTVPAAVTLLGERTWWPFTPKSHTAQRVDADMWRQTVESDAQTAQAATRD